MRQAHLWPEGRATVLLVLDPGGYGIRRHGPPVADPVLCTLDGCYVSTGPATPALFLPGRKALGFRNTWGARAGACGQSLACVFRAVELRRGPAYLQPIDLHLLRHDRRREQLVEEDSRCTAKAGRLSCSRAFYAEDYVMWVVPEAIAEAVGPEALTRALSDGLIGRRSAELVPRR